jgi:hypothetical protein
MLRMHVNLLISLIKKRLIYKFQFYIGITPAGLNRPFCL